MTETIDAPMSDSGDVDVSMFHGISASESWLSAEASMGDDGLIPESTSFSYMQEDVEIEMGDDDEPITEYEMADEGVAYEDELQDVEVYDVAPSPLPTQHHAADISVEDPEFMRLHSSDGLQPPVESSHPISFQPSDSFGVVDEVFTDHPADESGHFHAVEPESVAEEIQNATVPSFPTVEGEPAVPPVVVDELRRDNDADEPDSVAVSTHHQEVLGEEHYQDVVEHHSEPLETLQLGLEEPRPDAIEDGTAHDDHATAAPVDAKDPHEISEGVYIDPPPPVLLSMPPSATHSEFSLFNLPTTRHSRSPSGSNQPDAGRELPLLLQNRPTLYYEPLSAVFTALRSEQCVQELPQFSEAELVLDAYDLQLSISEVSLALPGYRARSLLI